MPVIGDILRIKDCQTMFGEELCNIFYYIVAVWTGNASYTDIVNAFLAQIVDELKTMQTSTLAHTNVRVDNLSDGLGFAEVVGNVPGTYPSGNTLPSAVAVGFRLSRTTKTTRPGGKRIAGISEDLVNVNDVLITNPVILATQVVLAQDIDVDIPAPGDGLLEPIIVGRNIDGTYDLLRYSHVSGSVASPIITTQVSRTPGR